MQGRSQRQIWEGSWSEDIGDWSSTYYVLVLLENTSSHGCFHWLSDSEIQVVDLFPFCLIWMSFKFGLLILVWFCLMTLWSCFTEEEDASSAEHGCILFGGRAYQSALLCRSWDSVPGRSRIDSQQTSSAEDMVHSIRQRGHSIQ